MEPCNNLAFSQALHLLAIHLPFSLLTLVTAATFPPLQHQAPTTFPTPLSHHSRRCETPHAQHPGQRRPDTAGGAVSGGGQP